ncbi:hypothetical protein HWV62_10140 [Athelia sp. TMB]|nr:hypothetical protein HWV62_10140 [Athelia sp. TMB]
MSSPRPILKRAQTQQCAPATAPRYPRSSLLHGSPSHGVHFPPSPTLTRTFTAHSPSTYDRSPIVVSQNTCALPERGCPGRTYTLDESPSHPPRAPTSGWMPHSGRHLHPRAVNSGYRAQSPLIDEEDDDDEAQRTPTCTMPALPRLIPDLSSSSESSEESDDFTPPAAYMPISYFPPPQTNPNHFPSHPPIPHAPYRYSSEGQQSYFAGTPTALSFLPHASDEDPAKMRRRKQREPSRTRDEKPGSPDRRRRADGAYKTLSVCKALANCSLDEAEVGCLGGF